MEIYQMTPFTLSTGGKCGAQRTYDISDQSPSTPRREAFSNNRCVLVLYRLNPVSIKHSFLWF